MLQNMLDEWISGRMKLSDEQERRGRAMVMSEMTELSLDAVLAFYGIEITETLDVSDANV